MFGKLPRPRQRVKTVLPTDSLPLDFKEFIDIGTIGEVYQERMEPNRRQNSGVHRDEPISDCAAAAAWVLAGGSGTSTGAVRCRIFPAASPHQRWRRFAAAGFARPVGDMISDSEDPPRRSLFFGGPGADCVDPTIRGVYAFRSSCNTWPGHPAERHRCTPRKRQGMQPLPGLTAWEQSGIVSAPQIARRELSGCEDPFGGHLARWIGTVRA